MAKVVIARIILVITVSVLFTLACFAIGLTVGSRFAGIMAILIPVIALMIWGLTWAFKHAHWNFD
jgi:hypothetical protein